MTKLLIIHGERNGSTEHMAKLIAEGAQEQDGATAALLSAREATPEDLADADAIVLGSPTHYGMPSAEVARLLEESVRSHGSLEGKVGGAFASAANIGGGGETTVMALIQAMLVHGMVVQGTPTGDHYGPVCIAPPDTRVKAHCRAYGKRIAELAHRLRAQE